LEFVNVDQGAGKQGRKKTEIPKQRLYSLPDMRQKQGGVSQVQNLPNLLQDHGQRRQDSRRSEGKLVIEIDETLEL